MSATAVCVPALFRWSARDGLGANGTLVARSFGTELDGVFSRASVKWVADRNGVLVPRVHSLPPLAWVNGEEHLLMERSSTNLLVRSQEFDNASWSKVSCSVSANQVLAPDATLTMDLLTAALTTGGVAQSVTFTGNGEKVFSVFLRQGSATVNGLLVYDVTAAVQRHLALVTWTAGIPALSTSAGSGTLFPPVWYYNDGWRVAISATGIVAANSHEVWIYPDRVSGTGTVYAWGAQAENATVPSSYIPTTSATVTRQADSLYFPFNALPQAMTMYVRGREAGGVLLSSDAGLAGIADSTDASWFIAGNSSPGYSALHRRSSDVSSGLGSAPVMGDVVEVRSTLSAAGAVRIGMALNGGAETLASESSTNALASAWALPRLYVGSRGWSPGLFAFSRVVVAAGTKTLAEMRALAEAA